MIQSFANKPGFLAGLESALASEFGSIGGLIEISEYKDSRLISYEVTRVTSCNLERIKATPQNFRVVDIDALLDLEPCELTLEDLICLHSKFVDYVGN